MVICKYTIKHVKKKLSMKALFSRGYFHRGKISWRFGPMKNKLKVVDKYQQLNEIYMKKNYKRKISPGKAHKIPISRRKHRNTKTSRNLEFLNFKSLGILFESLEENYSSNKARKISQWTIWCYWSNDDGNASRNCSIQVWNQKYTPKNIISSIGTYPELSENCYMGDWTFDNSFLFMGSMATTIGYGHIVPQEMVIFDYRRKFQKKLRKNVFGNWYEIHTQWLKL